VQGVLHLIIRSHTTAFSKSLATVRLRAARTVSDPTPYRRNITIVPILCFVTQGRQVPGQGVGHGAT
jgi:hypothetical protein